MAQLKGEKLCLLESIDSYLPHVDGVINCMHNYCKNASKSIDVVAAAPAYKDYKDEQPYNILRCKSMYVPILNIQYARATKDKKFHKAVMEHSYDIVHVNSPYNMAKYALKVAKEQNIPAVITYHTNMRLIFKMISKSDWIADKINHKLGKIYNSFDEVFTCSPIVAEQCRLTGYTGKISYLPLGTNVPKCNDVQALRQKAEEQLGIGKDELFFLFVGRIEKLKRIDFILKSLKILKEQGLKFKFFAVGKGSHLKKMQRLKRKLGFTDEEVRFTGFLNMTDGDLFSSLYARADLFLFPSVFDTFGLVKVEAAAYDTPGVFVNGSCAGYGVTDGVNGYLSDDNEQAFAQKIKEAVADREKLVQVGKNAGKDLYINWEECTNQFVQRLEKVVEEYNSNKK